MAEYRRFIAYFYEYINGKKQRNAGFAKVELRNGVWRLQFRLKPENVPESPIGMYGFVREGEYLRGFGLGTMRPGEEMTEELKYQADVPIGREKYRLEDIAGIRIQSGDGRCFMTVWDDEPIEPEKFTLEVSEMGTLPAEPGGEVVPDTEKMRQETESIGEEKNREEEPDAAVLPGAEVSVGRPAEPGMAALPGAEVSVGRPADLGMTVLPGAEAAGERPVASDMADAGRAGESGGAADVPDKRETEGTLHSSETGKASAALQRGQTGIAGSQAEQVRSGMAQEGKMDVAADIWEEGTLRKVAEHQPEHTSEAGETERAEGAGGVEAGMPAESAEAAQNAEPADSIEAAELTDAVQGADRRGENQSEYLQRADMDAGGLQASGADARRTQPDMTVRQTSPDVMQELFRKRTHFQPFSDNEIRSCVMIMPCDVIRLQQQNWKIGNSSFLQHGFYQNRHLLLGVLEEEGYVLGVPGIYNPQEQYMAHMFGFDRFKEARACARGRIAGYWYRVLEPVK